MLASDDPEGVFLQAFRGHNLKAVIRFLLRNPDIETRNVRFIGACNWQDLFNMTTLSSVMSSLYNALMGEGPIVADGVGDLV